MARIENETLTLTIPGELPIAVEAHYDIEIEGDRRSGEISYKIELGCIDWTVAGHKMYCIEGKEIPPALRDRILAAITVSEHDLAEALSEAADWDAFEREHAAGRL